MENAKAKVAGDQNVVSDIANKTGEGVKLIQNATKELLSNKDSFLFSILKIN